MRARFMALAVAVIGCTSSGTPEAAGIRADSTLGLTVANTKEDEQAIRDAESRWRKNLTARDTAAIGTFYAEDAIYSPQGSPAYQGRDSVVGRWAREFQIPGFKLERTPLRIDIARSGDLANEVGTYAVQFQDHDKQQAARGTYMTAWRKTDGEWKISSYMWNRDEPESSPMRSRR
jgi:ketosteroid isomerase-like protein